MNILKLENILTNQSQMTREEAIIKSGQIMLENNFITEDYIVGMLKRDDELSTFIGNYIAIPHGEYEYKEDVLETGLTVLVIPEGIDWQGEEVKVVIGIAAKNDEHLDIIANIAIKLSDIETVEELIQSSPEHILDLLTN